MKKSPLGFCLVLIFLLIASTTQLVSARDTTPSIPEAASWMVQFLIFIGCYFLLEDHVGRKTKDFLAGLIFTCGVMLNIDCYLLRHTSYTLTGLVQITILGGDIWSALKEIQVTPASVASVLVFLSLVFWGGVFLNRKLFRLEVKKASQIIICFNLILGAAFIGEQFWSHTRGAYGLRSIKLPSYIKLFSSPIETITFPLPEAPNQKTIETKLRAVTKAKNPKNVLFILLESVRADFIDAEKAPHLQGIADRGLSFKNAWGEGITTSLIWNTLFTDRPPFTFENDVKNIDKVSLGAIPFEVLRQAGYSVSLSFSTNAQWKGNERRILGSGKLVDHFFRAYQGDYKGRDVFDKRATDQVINWLSTKNPRPFFIFIQLDSTHWPYEFDDSQATFNPYAQDHLIFQFDSKEGLQKLQNRYANALHQVDSNVGRILQALKDQNLSKDTAVIFVSDHGEQFANGHITHLSLAPATKQVPLAMELPGQGHQDVDTFVTHRRIFPTLFDYLGIQVPNDILLGKSALKGGDSQRALLTFNGSLRRAEMILSGKIIYFDVRTDDSNIKFTPQAVSDFDGNFVNDWTKDLDGLPWKQQLSSWVTSSR